MQGSNFAAMFFFFSPIDDCLELAGIMLDSTKAVFVLNLMKTGINACISVINHHDLTA